MQSSAPFSLLLVTNIILVLQSQPLNLCSFHRLGHEIGDACKTTDELRVLHIFSFIL